MPTTISQPRSDGSPFARLLAALIVRSIVAGWVVMLLLGILHHEVNAQVLALGYWPSVVIVYLAGVVLGIAALIVKGTQAPR